MLPRLLEEPLLRGHHIGVSQAESPPSSSRLHFFHHFTDDGGVFKRTIWPVYKHGGIKHLHTTRIDAELLNIGLQTVSV